MPYDVSHGIKPGGHQVFELGTPFPDLMDILQADVEMGDVAPSPPLVRHCKAHCSTGSLICSSPLPLPKITVVLLLSSLYTQPRLALTALYFGAGCTEFNFLSSFLSCPQQQQKPFASSPNARVTWLHFSQVK